MTHNNPSAAFQVEEEIGAQALWTAFAKTPGVGVCVVTPGGDVLFASEESQRIYLGQTNPGVIGQNIGDLFPEGWAEERKGYYRRVVESRQPLTIREVWHGMQLCSTIRPILDENCEINLLLGLSQLVPTQSPSPTDHDQVESEFIELGELDVLTPRELVVLALVGQGLSLKEIAAKLHRSFKTVDNHRASIGRKLRQTDRVALARIAAHAGLQVRDAELTRVRRSEVKA
jgi:DNA-binding CsgD family transcriptional regulator